MRTTCWLVQHWKCLFLHALVRYTSYTISQSSLCNLTRLVHNLVKGPYWRWSTIVASWETARQGGILSRTTSKKRGKTKTRNKGKEQEGKEEWQAVRQSQRYQESEWLWEEQRQRDISEIANKESRRKWGGVWEREGGPGREAEEKRGAEAEGSSLPVEEIRGLHPVWLMS